MPVCARCGQQTEAAAEFCQACAAVQQGAFPTGAASGFGSGEAVIVGPGATSGLAAGTARSAGRPASGPPPAALATSLPSLDRLAVPAQPGELMPPASSAAPPASSAAPPAGPAGPEVTALADADPAGRAAPGQVGTAWREETSRDTRNGHWIALAVAAVVLVGTAAALTVALYASQPGGSRAAGAGASAPARASTKPGQTGGAAAASGGTGLISVAPAAAGSAHATAVVTFLTRYFTAINGHDYAAYRKLFRPAVRAELSAQEFSAGYGSTRDSLAVLRSVGVARAGRLDVLITFTSHQRPAGSPTHSACTRWSIRLYLVRRDGSYLLQRPPSGYRASFRACS